MESLKANTASRRVAWDIWFNENARIRWTACAARGITYVGIQIKMIDSY